MLFGNPNSVASVDAVHNEYDIALIGKDAATISHNDVPGQLQDQKLFVGVKVRSKNVRHQTFFSFGSVPQSLNLFRALS